MSILADARTRLLALDLSHHEGALLTLSMFMARLGTVLGLAHPPLDIDEVRQTVVAAGVESLLIVVVGAQRLPAACFLRADRLLRAACQRAGCQTHWLLDDISMLERLPLTMQANIVLHRVAGRPSDDTLLDLLSGLLSHAKVLPSGEFLGELRGRLERGVSLAELRLFVKLCLLEHYIGQSQDPSGLWELASVRQALETIPNPTDETVRETGTALAAAARTALGRLTWAWTVLTTVRSLWGEEACPAADLLQQPAQLDLILPRWHMRISSSASSSASDGMRDLRQMQLFQRALANRASDSPTTKKLLAALPSADLEAFLRVIGDFVSSQLDMNTGTLLGDFCQMAPGRVTAKLMTPRPVEVLQMALEHPEFYQRGQVHREPQQGAGPSDTSIVLRLAGECGKFINTHDWYVSYRQLADPQRSQEEPSLM